jgi:hypothetical protein
MNGKRGLRGMFAIKGITDRQGCHFLSLTFICNILSEFQDNAHYNTRD